MENKENNTKELSNNNSYNLFEPIFDSLFRFPTFRSEMKDINKLMRADIHETESNYELELELPGFDKKDIEIELKNGYLTVEASKNNSNQNSSCRNCIRRERYYGNIARSFYVGEINRDEIDATLENGILKVSLPKEQNKDKMQKIEIK